MLVLSRKKGETVLIGQDIEISILEVTAEGVKIGINAPKEITILRKELYKQIAESNIASIQDTMSKSNLAEQYKKIKNLNSL